MTGNDSPILVSHSPGNVFLTLFFQAIHAVNGLLQSQVDAVFVVVNYFS